MAKTQRLMHDLQMAAPCSTDWEQMPGTARVRRCQKCPLTVYHVSDLTRAEAEAIVAQKEGHACPSLYRRQDGTVLTQDCPKGVAALRKASRWWKERIFHLFLFVLPWLIITGFIYIDPDMHPDGSYGIWDVEPFKSLDALLGSGTTAPGGLKPLPFTLTTVSVNSTVWSGPIAEPPEDIDWGPPPDGFPDPDLPEPAPLPRR